MGYTADARLVYGIIIGEDFEPPWEDDDNYYDIKHWWAVQNGFECSLTNWRDDYRVFFDELRSYLGSPSCLELPVEEVFYGHFDYPVTVLVKKGKHIKADWCDPTEVDIRQLVLDNDDGQLLIDFCTNFGIEFDPKDGPKWWLCASYG